MKEKLLNHLITLFLRIDNEFIIFNEEKECQKHIIAINDIEKKLPKYGIYHNTGYNDILTEFAFYYASMGHILVGQMNHIFFIYLPEIIDEITEKTFINIKKNLQGYETYIQKKDGEYWKTFDIEYDKEKRI